MSARGTFAGSDNTVRHTTEIRESYQASVDAEQRERAANTQSAGTTLESLRRKKDDGVTEKRVIYPPGGLTHVSIKDPEASSTVPAAGTMATDLAAAASSGTRTAWMEAEPAGLRLIGNPVRMRVVWCALASACAFCCCPCRISMLSYHC